MPTPERGRIYIQESPAHHRAKVISVLTGRAMYGGAERMTFWHPESGARSGDEPRMTMEYLYPMGDRYEGHIAVIDTEEH